MTESSSKLSSNVIEVVEGDVLYRNVPIIYIVRSNETNYINFVKPLILAQELGTPHQIAIVNTKDPFYGEVHPERFVPAINDRCPVTHQEINVFESTACLQYLAAQYDSKGLWTGQNAWERGQVMSWTEYQTAGLGATAKFWLYFQVVYPTSEGREPPFLVIDHLKELTMKQWSRLNDRLSKPDQQYVALPDRPTIADISYLPFSMPWMFKFFKLDIKDWPYVATWAETMMSRPSVKEILAKAPTYGQ